MEPLNLFADSGLESPMFGMMALTLLVWIYMYVRRLSWAAANPEEAKLIRSPDKLAQYVPEEINWSSDNLKNLFELPVLFYAICLFLIFSRQSDQLHIWCAWGFFVLRAAHSAVQCTTNILMLRFGIYIASAVCLWLMLIRTVLGNW